MQNKKDLELTLSNFKKQEKTMFMMASLLFVGGLFGVFVSLPLGIAFLSLGLLCAIIRASSINSQLIIMIALEAMNGRVK